ncbi:hypothetical protein HUT06_21370 [Actinomadura sp. NAK00032]|uniref:hypothetical protein n=1 Tax=Actinomadura sp. NAK00032 TaxID=2742128 RepID=UPI0015926692|nr:hypothetical protein [Actinomadura sp. NAK00032]QKW36268.1 hypothetical protein HUT06_21370 [Actinomadura sp. NAK00032]
MTASNLRVSVGYHQYWLEWAAWDPGAIPFTGGNGLVWVSPGRMVVMTGTDSGDIGVEIEVTDHAPPPDLDDWDDAVEVSADITGTTVELSAPVGISVTELRLPAPGTYRFRVHARGRDAGHDAEYIDADEGDTIVEHHKIQIWPAPPTAETTLKLTDNVGTDNRSHT